MNNNINGEIVFVSTRFTGIYCTVYIVDLKITGLKIRQLKYTIVLLHRLKSTETKWLMFVYVALTCSVNLVLNKADVSWYINVSAIISKEIENATICQLQRKFRVAIDHPRHGNLISKIYKESVITRPENLDKSRKELTSSEDDTGPFPILSPAFSGEI